MSRRCLTHLAPLLASPVRLTGAAGDLSGLSSPLGVASASASRVRSRHIEPETAHRAARQQRGSSSLRRAAASEGERGGISRCGVSQRSATEARAAAGMARAPSGRCSAWKERVGPAVCARTGMVERSECSATCARAWWHVHASLASDAGPAGLGKLCTAGQSALAGPAPRWWQWGSCDLVMRMIRCHCYRSTSLQPRPATLRAVGVCCSERWTRRGVPAPGRGARGAGGGTCWLRGTMARV